MLPSLHPPRPQTSVVWRCDRSVARQFLLEGADQRVIKDLTEKRRLYSILTDHYLFKRLDPVPGAPYY